jgi:hypothetical protein
MTWEQSRESGFCPCIVADPCLDPVPLPEGFVPVEVVIDRSLSDDEFEARVSAAAARKWDDCKGYDTCLEYASCMDWNQFSCQDCGGYESADPKERFMIPVTIHAHWDFDHEVIGE